MPATYSRERELSGFEKTILFIFKYKWIYGKLPHVTSGAVPFIEVK